MWWSGTAAACVDHCAPSAVLRLHLLLKVCCFAELVGTMGACERIFST